MASKRVGATEPRIFTPPLVELTEETSLGFEVIWFAEEMLGLELRPWQKWLLIHGLELDPTTIPGHKLFDPSTPKRRYNDFRFREVVVLVGRQNGKTLVMTVLGLWRLFMDGASEVLSTAQKLSVAEGALKAGFDLVKKDPRFTKYLPHRTEKGVQVPYMRETNGDKRLALTRPPRGLEHVLDAAGTPPQWVVTAASGAARSYSADLALLDEVREQTSEVAWDAIAPTTRERPRNQIWCFSNAGTEDSVLLRRLRNVGLRAIREDDRQVLTGLFEWSAPDDVDIFDPTGWYAANPSMGFGNRTEADMLALAKAAVDPEVPDSTPDGFRTEYLCQWRRSLEVGRITEQAWAGCADTESSIPETAPVVVGVDVAEAGSKTVVAVAGVRADGRVHVEIVAARAGYRWVPGWLEARRDTWFDGRVGVQVRGSASAVLVPLLEDAGIGVCEWQGAAMSSSITGFVAAVNEGRVAHRGRDPKQPTVPTGLEASAVGVRDRKAGDTFIWDRGNSVGDPTPLVAVNIAWWMATARPWSDELVSAYAADDWQDDPESVGEDELTGAGVLFM